MRFSAAGEVTSAVPTQLGLSVGHNRRRHERGVRIASVVLLRTQGHSIRECAKILDLSPYTVKDYIRTARRDGTLGSGLDESISRLQNDILPEAVENIGRKVAAGHLETSMKVAEGMGAFTAKVHGGGSQASTGPPPQVNIQINAPPSADAPVKIVSGVPNR